MLDVSNKKHPSKMAIEEFIEKLVEYTKSTGPQSDNYSIVEDTDNYLGKLEKAFNYFSNISEKKKIAPSGVEWFLDNYYVIQETIELIRDDLPEEYFNKLPSVGEITHTPRIYHIARVIIAHYKIEVLRNDLDEFLNAYQQFIPLRMSELWALPLMLRLTLIEILSASIFNLIENHKPSPPIENLVFSDIPSDEVIARCLRSLLLFDRIDWKVLFESHSIVEKYLQKDPAKVYPLMDFDTRDIYRKSIENLSENTKRDEAEVAQIVIEMAKNPIDNSKKANHVGFYLIGDGESQLKSELGYKTVFPKRMRKFFFEHNTVFYLGGISLITLIGVLGLVLISQLYTTAAWKLIILGLLILVPASSVAVNLINSIMTAILPPCMLPKMDFSKRIPKKFRTVVVIPALMTNPSELNFLLQQLELHYLANKDKNIAFALLSDLNDAPHETMPNDDLMLNSAIEGINALNEHYQGDQGRWPFYIFHRRRQWNPKEGVWMGWERKRGKLTDFNRYLLEGYEKSFDTIIGELDFLKSVRFVITVDSDTVLPRDSANALIATLAHPLNQAEFEDGTSRVTRGFTILQPRTEVKPTSVNKSFFTRVFAGDLGLDLYTRAVSDVYQDLFGEGIYVGKGIYDLEAFQRSLINKVPENALLSHDLFEGLQGRAGLVSDIVFFEEYPPDYASQVQRLHRWVRGDWQLVPWLFPKVPMSKGKSAPNPFPLIDKWKIFDNLRRSLLAPTTLLSLIFGWLIFQDRTWIWTLLILFVSAFPLLNNIVSSLSSRFLMGAKSNIFASIKTALYRWLFWLIFLPYESFIMLDAIVTTFVRVYISHKRLLQWQTAAHTIRLFGQHHKIGTIWQRMIGAPIFSVLVGVLIYIFKPNGFWFSLPLLLLWILSPQIAYWISLMRKIDQKEALSESDLRKLREAARRTWLYFERFIGPDDHWLPPDHFQEFPKGLVAHRTSPTNIGLLMLSTAAAYDFGYIGMVDFIYRMNYTFGTLDELEKYRGHLLNWYDTRSLETLSPRYVSTVDSGNFAASLIGLYQTLKDLPEHAVCPSVLFQGSFDSLDVFCNVISSIKIEDLDDIIQPVYSQCRNIQQEIRSKPLTDSWQMDLLSDFIGRLSEPLNVLIKEISVMDEVIDQSVMQNLRYWSEAVFQHFVNTLQQIEILAPWMKTWQSRPDFLDEMESIDLKQAFSVWHEEQALCTVLSVLPELCDDTTKQLETFLAKEDNPDLSSLKVEQIQSLKTWLQIFIGDLQKSKENTVDLFDQINKLMQKIDFYIERMEFKFLYDKKRDVFFLGYQVGSGRLDQNHYDLLASEARTASLIAIAQNEVPRSHWLHMSRPFTEVTGIPTLVSWNGSMFEYLMPNLFTHTYPGTLLHQTSEGIVNAQINYGKKNNVPWGISESSYYRFDQAENYQYKGFGVPSLGRKRGLADDLVIAPYASLMAVGVKPRAVLKNIDALIEEGAQGNFGFFESIDYTKSRLPIGQKKAIIKSYMAHHQGMILVALANFLNPIGIVDRFHNDPRIQSTELLLQEQIPESGTIIKIKEVQVSTQGQKVQSINMAPWTIDTERPGLAAHVLSNDNLRMIMTESGSGYLEWNNVALTRWRQDAALDPWGIWFYIQNLDQNKTWSIGRQPIHAAPQEYRVIFSPHMIEIRQKMDEIRVIMQTTIAPKEDICFHKISLTNQGSEKRQYRILSYGEVVLAPQATDLQHPAFNKMFIESNYHEDLKMLHFQRRKRSADEKSLGMAHLMYDEMPGQIEYESDREKFIGRGHNLSNPIAVTNNNELSATIGLTLDPIFSLGKQFTLGPNQTVILTYMTLATEEEDEAVKIASQYQNSTRINSAFSSAQSHSEKLLRALVLNSNKLSMFQALLSRILYTVPELRPEAALLEKNNLGQSSLWPFGISGDDPIMLVMVNNKEEIETLQEALLAHTYWRKMGLMIDLVILNTKDAGYTNDLNEKIHQTINVMDSQIWVNRHGGIFVLTASQIDDQALRLIKTAASVVIDFHTHDLDEFLHQALLIEPNLPLLIPTGQEKDFSTNKTVNLPHELILVNGIGGFTPDGKEYQIFLEDYPKLSDGSGQITPAPWVNVVANKNFGFLVSESGGGYTWSKNSGENRLTPWTNDPVEDPAGESLYLRDEVTGKVWSPTPLPSGEGGNYLVRHGQGYSIFESFNQGFRQVLKVYTDADAPVKIIEVTLINESKKHRRITATYYAEWVLGVNREKTMAFIVPSYNSQSGSLMARNSYSADFSECVAFLTSDHPVHGLTTDRREFLGSPGNRHKPAGLQRIGLSGRVKTGVDPCAALQIHLNFTPDEEQNFTFVLGQGASMDEAKLLAETFSHPDKIQKSWSKVSETWDAFLKTIQVETPSPEMDLMLNRWLQYQTLSCRIWGRSAFYQSSGAYGFRDQLQDVMSLLVFKPEISRDHILRSASHQFDSGDVLHWWHPPSGQGVRTRITDDLLWLIYVTAEYVLKTGDISILDEKVPFRLGEPLEEAEEERYGSYQTSEKSYTLFEHCRRALEHGDTEGPHGLPLIGGGDWNDGMNRVGIKGLGESVWLAWFLVENHLRFAHLCDLLDKQANASEHRDQANHLKEVVNQTAWDGEWFLRGYYDNGSPLGSHNSEECQIDSLPQSWSILTHGAPEERQEIAIKSVAKLLVQKDGRLIRLFTPPFDKTVNDPGYIKGYPPGVRENGGQYSHAATWAVWALTELGEGTEAFNQFEFLNPITHSLDVEEANRYKVEPYVVAADIYSTPPFTGRGGWTWYTGSSGWLYRLGTEAILGFQLEGNHFKINPCIPDTWDGFKLTYQKEDCIYKIQVNNPDHVQKGVNYVSMDGERLEDFNIPLLKDHLEHEVIVIMG